MNLIDKIAFGNILLYLETNGYAEEIEWQRNLKPVECSYVFLEETCWVILNSGMKEQIARKIWNRIQEAWQNGVDIAEVFKHKGKVPAIKYVANNFGKLFEEYVLSENKIDFLKTIPFIGNITCYHLAKNLGHDCVKPDRHLERLAKEHDTTPDKLCEAISRFTEEKKCVVDIVLWRACNLKLI